jgi:hypothetical protein
VGEGSFSQDHTCKTISNLMVPGAGAFGGLEVCSVSQDFPVNLAEHLPGAVTDSMGNVVDYRFNAHLTSVEVLPNMGVESFGFVDRLSATVRPASGNPSMLREATVGDYVKSADNPDPMSLEIALSGDFNVLDYLRAGDLTLKLTFSGRLPTDPFSVDLHICFQVGVDGTITTP